MANKYSEYFNIDKDFFRCIDHEAIRKTPELWKKTYPHPTFVELLKNMERMLSGSKSPVWVHGAYGTGKSQCAYALKKILEVPVSELHEYWNKFDVLQTNANRDLLTKLCGHKERRIVSAYRYASGGINGTRDLLLAIQDSVKAALIDANVEYTGENTLRDSVIAWIDDPTRKAFFDSLLQKPEYMSRFAQSTADEVLSELRKGGELKELMDNIFFLADKEGVTALNLDTDRLIAWLKDVILHNDIKIVLVWDEFSDFFKGNRNSLSEFQKIASLAQSTAFYFIIVTHQTSSVIANSQDQSWKVVQQRYEFTEIKLPYSIAFELIGSALDVLSTAKMDWDKIADNLYSEVPESSRAVIEQVKKIEPSSTISADVLKKIMPLHPYAAMILKYIASAFEANQRSMFDFIKTADNEDIKAFQWFISNTAQDDERPLLTVDLLWDFFYEKGRNNLSADVQSILDTFPRQQSLNEKQKTVLKAILIIQATDQRTAVNDDIELFRLTRQNLSLAFEGVSELDGNAAINIAEQLVKEGVLIKRKIGNNQEVYAVVPLAGGGQAKIKELEDKLRESLTAAKLVTDGGLSTVLELDSPLKLRYDIDFPYGKLLTATLADFTKTINNLKNQTLGWRFAAVLCFAKDDSEVTAFRKTIEEAAANDDYKHIVFIDTLSVPLGADAFEQYIGFEALSMFYSGNDNDLAKKYAKDAKNVLDVEWRNRIKRGELILYSSANRGGERFPNATGIISELKSLVITRYPLVMDFNKGLTESMLKLTNAKASAISGATQSTKGVVVNIERFTLAIAPNSVWRVDKYWEQPALATLPISKIKIAIETKIADAFSSGNGQIAIRDIYDLLEETYGYSQSNLSAFLAGFLLKEYCTEEYRFIDSAGKPLESLPKEETLGFMLSDYIGNSNMSRYKDTYIARMTADERAFYELSEKAFDILPNSCATVGVAALAIGRKMGELGLPIWALSEVDDCGVYDIVEKYITLVQKEGAEAQTIAIEIGKIAQIKSTLGNNLHTLITKANCQNGIREFLKTFENGKILDLAREINAESTNLIDDIRRLFAVERSHLWVKSTGEDVLRRLLTEYGIASKTNAIISVNTTSLKSALAAWRDKLKFVRISADAAKAKYPNLSKLMDFMLKIYGQVELLPEQLKAFLFELTANEDELTKFLNDERLLFTDVYSAYLDGFNSDDIEEIISKLQNGMFSLSSSECNIKIKDEAEKHRKGQLKVKLFSLWKQKTGSMNPRKWSSCHNTPILAMVVGKDYDKAEKAFETLNQNNPPEFAIKDALAFLETATFIEDLNSAEKRDAAFLRHIIGDYAKMLTVEQVRDYLEQTTLEAYRWFTHPDVKDIVKKLAVAEYRSGGSDKALSILSEMTDEKQKEYIHRLITENVSVGIEIITRGGE